MDRYTAQLGMFEQHEDDVEARIQALLVARDHIEMSALELSHPKDADLIRAALSHPAQSEGGKVVAWALLNPSA